MKQRLDQALALRGVVTSRSQAESYIKLGQVRVNGRLAEKPGLLVDETAKLELLAKEQYVSRAALKLASVAAALKLNFANKLMLDIGSSTGGFTDYALQHGARKVIAVDVGTRQLHPSLLGHPKIELHEQMDIRDFVTHEQIDLVVADVSFISLREILPTVSRLASMSTQIAVMVKPQFEATAAHLKHKGVIKNDKMRREVLKSFEDWVQHEYRIVDKADSHVSGANGNIERFYLLAKLPK